MRFPRSHWDKDPLIISNFIRRHIFGPIITEVNFSRPLIFHFISYPITFEIRIRIESHLHVAVISFVLNIINIIIKVLINQLGIWGWWLSSRNPVSYRPNRWNWAFRSLFVVLIGRYHKVTVFVSCICGIT